MAEESGVNVGDAAALASIFGGVVVGASVFVPDNLVAGSVGHSERIGLAAMMIGGGAAFYGAKLR